MALSFQNAATLVANSVAKAQATCSKLLDFSTGSILLAIMEANASIALWMQWLLTLLMKRQRLATSEGVDVDSWVGDFALTRLPAVPATGIVTLSRFTATVSATVPVGTTVRTSDASTTFAILEDGDNAHWNGVDGYTMPIGTASIDVPVQAVTSGASGNVQANTVTLLGSALPGVDTVNNAAAFVNGFDAETDAQLQARFPAYLTAREKATATAIGSAIMGVQQGLTYAIAANMDETGAFKPGHFVVTIDDGSGEPSSALQASVYAAVDAVRSVCETFSVQPPTVQTVSVSMTMTAVPGYIKANMRGPLAVAIAAFIDSLPVGTPLYYAQLAQVAYSSLPGIGSITALLLNGGTADVTGGPSTVLRAGSVVVN